jgi:hypothetical protein
MEISIFILKGIGIISLSASLLADLIGVGAFPGFGYKQVIGIAIGVVFIIIGLIMDRIKNKEGSKDRIFILLQQFLKSKLNNDVFIAAVLFALSFVIRLLYYYSHLDLTTYESIVGVPFCDARHWNEAAIHIAQGKGLSGFNRPFYPIFLAIFYTWFDPSFFLAKIVNIIINSLTISFIYLIGRKVFHQFISLAAAIIAVVNIDYLKTNLTIMTEPLGLFLFVLSCYLLILGLERKSYGLLLFVGVVFSLSNLARTMTLVALPGYLIIMFYILKKQNISYKKISYLLSIFIFGVLMTLAPWMIRQKMVYGIFTISPNSANLIYAATSPKYQQWNSQEVQEAVEKGLITVREQYDYFMKGTLNNIIHYPFFYLINCLKSAYKFMACYKFPLSPIPQKVEFLLCLAGIVLFFITLKNSYALILINSLIFLVIGSAMVANAGTPYRLFTMVSWIFDFFYILTLAYVVCFVYFKIILKRDESYSKRLVSNDNQIGKRLFHDEEKLKKYLKYIGLLFLFFFIISSTKIAYLSFVNSPSGEVVPSLSIQEKMKILTQINTIRPGSFNNTVLKGDIFTEPKNQFINDPNDYKDHGKIIVHLSKIDKYIYYIPKEEKIHDWFRLFTFRNYGRTIFSMGNWGWVFYIFPDKIPDDLKEKYVIAVGKMNIDMNFNHEARRIVELIAIIPYQGDYDLRKTILATNEEHWKILNDLRN